MTAATKSQGTPAPNNTGAGGPVTVKRTLSVFDLVVFGMIFMVPIAPFSILASVSNTSHGMPALAYVIAMVAMLFTAFSFDLMVPRYPSSGSIFVYASDEINGPVGFVVGWLMLLQYLITPAVMLIMAGLAIHEYVPAVPVWAWCLIFLAIITVIAMRGAGATVMVDKLALVAELIVLLLFFIFGVIYVAKNPSVAHFSFEGFYNPGHFEMGAVMSAVSLCALSFVGFGSVVTLDDQSLDPKHGPSRAMIVIVLILGALYMAMSLLTMCMDPSGKLMAANPNNGFYPAAGLAGKWLGVLCAVANALALGIFTSLSGMTAGASLLRVMAKDDALPSVFAKISPKTRVATVATGFVAVLTLALIFIVLPIGMTTGAKISNYGALSTYFMLNIAVIWGPASRRGFSSMASSGVRSSSRSSAQSSPASSSARSAARCSLWAPCGSCSASSSTTCGRRRCITSRICFPTPVPRARPRRNASPAMHRPMPMPSRSPRTCSTSRLPRTPYRTSPRRPELLPCA